MENQNICSWPSEKISENIDHYVEALRENKTNLENLKLTEERLIEALNFMQAILDIRRTEEVNAKSLGDTPQPK